MPRTANPYRIALCRELGAEVVLVETVHEAFDRARAIEQEEGRTLYTPSRGRSRHWVRPRWGWSSSSRRVRTGWSSTR